MHLQLIHLYNMSQSKWNKSETKHIQSWLRRSLRHWPENIPITLVLLEKW